LKGRKKTKNFKQKLYLRRKKYKGKTACIGTKNHKERKAMLARIE
jgi:hypothetical protein